MSFTGQMLINDSIDPQINLEAIGTIFNDTFLVAHEAATEVGLETANEIFFETSRQWIMMICSGLDTKVHLHWLAIMDKEGNLALLRMTIQKLFPSLIEDKIFLKNLTLIEEKFTQKVELTEENTDLETFNLASKKTPQPSKNTKQKSSSNIQVLSDFIEVLIVHDNAVLSRKIELEFDKLNIQPDLADSLKKATKLMDKKKYDIVFSGTRLPDGNGYEVCRMLKKHPIMKQCVVVLLSGTLSPYERVRSRLVGYDGYFSIQDITSKKLALFIERHLKNLPISY